MIDPELLKIGDQLKNVVEKQIGIAQNALAAMPEGEAKQELKDLLKAASTGKVTHTDAQKKVEEILKKYAGTN